MNISVAFLGLLFVVATLSTTSPFAEPRKQNLSKFLYSKPVGVSASFDCAAKKAAVEYAQVSHCFENFFLFTTSTYSLSEALKR